MELGGKKGSDFAAEITDSNEIDLKGLRLEVKEMSLAFKALADLVNEALINNKALNSRQSATGQRKLSSPTPTQSLIGAFRKEQAVKKLFKTPTPPRRAMNSPKLDKKNTASRASPLSTTSNGKSIASCGKRKISECNEEDTATNPGGFTLPMGMESNYPPTPEMLLLRREMILAHYIFHPEMDNNEILFQLGNKKVTRLDFQSFCPPNEVNHEIITLKTMKTTYLQRDEEFPSVWSLPPSFVDDVFNGLTINELKETYAKVWMPPYIGLKYVYVPIRDERGHWFVMVISLVDEAIYHLDSNLQMGDDLIERRKIMATLCAAISDIVSECMFPKMLLTTAKKLTSWNIIQAAGIPNRGTSVDSGVWVLKWLELEKGFGSHLDGNLNEDAVRMRSATDLVSGWYNEKRREIEESSEAFWKMMIAGEAPIGWRK
ncbi:uncharacterized protein LOC130741047 [Lotus japonicus]|uniref:uncharacterized protein LOC130741047 n=1 Tax=Lotus japonicus TaxID=34305 RepID=UPI00258668ED|nr:uncharacterized protein LOC130741047 [Lotus japonicus]